jgi:hypothetical protein
MLQLEERRNISSIFINSLMKDLWLYCHIMKIPYEVMATCSGIGVFTILEKLPFLFHLSCWIWNIEICTPNRNFSYISRVLVESKQHIFLCSNSLMTMLMLIHYTDYWWLYQFKLAIVQTSSCCNVTYSVCFNASFIDCTRQDGMLLWEVSVESTYRHMFLFSISQIEIKVAMRDI